MAKNNQPENKKSNNQKSDYKPQMTNSTNDSKGMNKNPKGTNCKSNDM